MVIERTGTYGSYFGTTYDDSAALTQSEMEVNALYIYNSLTASGWSIESICGMLGNMQVESSLNPGRWENDTVGGDPTAHGYGLVQWTPYTNYTDWATSSGYSDPSIMDANLARINYELENNLQWIPTMIYPMSFAAFKVSTASPEVLAMTFLANYERPANPSQPIRGEYALAWYSYLSGHGFKSERPHRFKWVLYANKLRNKY